MLLVTSVLCALAYLGLINWAAYRAFADDKARAIRKDQQRIPEAHLLHLARIGGWIGAKIAQQRLRHKSYKQPFGSRLNIIGMVHALSIVTCALILSILAVVPTQERFIPATLTAAAAAAAAPDVQPAPGPPQISLRPPAGRP